MGRDPQKLRLTVVGGAAYRRPTPTTGDIDIRIESPEKITEGWKEQFSTPETLKLIQEVSDFIWDLWGEPIELDLNFSDREWAVIFRGGRPVKRLPFKKFRWEYCL